MKRNFSGGGGAGKSKMWDGDEEHDAGDDELLAMLGYKVKSADMADVADKIQQLEEAMVNDDELSQLASDSVHYNPSNLSTWLETMMVELNQPQPQPLVVDDSAINLPPATVDPTTSAFMENLVPDDAIHPPAKKIKPLSVSNNSNQAILVDSQDNGIRLVHTLMACAGAVHQQNFQLAENLVKHAGNLAVSQAGPMRKVAAYFSEALARRIYRFKNQTPQESPAINNILQMHFYEACPYLKFAHFTANQAILEAFAFKKRVHVIDFSMNQGIQWPALLQALAVRPGGPPSFRLTGIGMENSNHLQESGWKLGQLADSIRVEFDYKHLVVESFADIEPGMLDLRDGEVVAVNSVFELHKVLARPGAVERLLSAVRRIKPEIVTVVEQEANHNGLDFMERFNESLHYYSTIFDSLESSCNGGGGGGGGSSATTNKDKIMSEVYLGKQICNVVACEGEDRVERHETVTQWKTRFDSAGFQSAHLGSNAFRQASMLLAIFAGGDGYKVEENDGCLMLGWHTRALITTSAWKLR
ncbi:hypothetical protein L6452_17950 [Arctium lappa]|uniref:Uncharacterized protein n=1 Tax=Arctium lappa TaxID=4217 RepID=A0ACB9C4W1_ARCLA|nr:hypothetical protein L6452_17950 [Arctium lappa]